MFPPEGPRSREGGGWARLGAADGGQGVEDATGPLEARVVDGGGRLRGQPGGQAGLPPDVVHQRLDQAWRTGAEARPDPSEKTASSGARNGASLARIDSARNQSHGRPAGVAWHRQDDRAAGGGGCTQRATAQAGDNSLSLFPTRETQRACAQPRQIESHGQPVARAFKVRVEELRLLLVLDYLLSRDSSGQRPECRRPRRRNCRNCDEPPPVPSAAPRTIAWTRIYALGSGSPSRMLFAACRSSSASVTNVGSAGSSAPSSQPSASSREGSCWLPSGSWVVCIAGSRLWGAAHRAAASHAAPTITRRPVDAQWAQADPRRAGAGVPGVAPTRSEPKVWQKS